MPAKLLRLGTRASPLALAQAELAAAALRAAHGIEVLLVPMTSEGDRVQDRPLAEIGGKALWTRTLDRALMDGSIDAAVHSMKDVETLRPPEIALAALLPRADPRDRLIGASSLGALPPGATVGTSSPRRAAQLLRLRPDLRIIGFRGNVATRLAKLERGDADATLLAAAGLDRLGHPDIGVALPVETMLPACAQGAIGAECRAGDAATRTLLAGIDDAATRAAVTAERALLAALGADCHSPVGAHAADGVMTGEILSEEGRLHVRLAGSPDAPEALAHALLAAAPPALRALFMG